MTTYQGSCHCGKIAYEVTGDPQQVLECNCSICSRKGYQLWFVPAADVKLKTPESDISIYTFNKHVIKHSFCDTCGCSTFGRAPNPKTGEDTYAINVRCVPEIDASKLKVIHYDGLSV